MTQGKGGTGACWAERKQAVLQPKLTPRGVEAVSFQGTPQFDTLMLSVTVLLSGREKRVAMLGITNDLTF